MALFFLMACGQENSKGIVVYLKNESSQAIMNIDISTSERLESLTFDALAPNESVKAFLSMEKNESDGSYTLSFTRADGKQEKYGGGYYSNGGPLDRRLKIKIKEASAEMHFSGVLY